MGEQPASVSPDGFESRNDAVRGAENGEAGAVIAHAKHVVDVVPLVSWTGFRREAIRALVPEQVAREGR